MANKTVYVCNECGYETIKWMGKCPACGEWNTFFEETVKKNQKNSFSADKKVQKSEIISNVNLEQKERLNSGFDELNRVLGGGIVLGSVNLLGGDPGIGKSTILIQICKSLADGNKKILYASGEESKTQIKMRAVRVGALSDSIYLYSQNELTDILTEAKNISPDVLVVDSIQTVYCEDIQSAPGTVTQVRECTIRLMRFAKENNVCVFIVGHITKDGTLAGPKILEHIVDCVLYFEGEKQSSYRMIRTNKNRFGSTNEMAVFDMREEGLKEIKNPSQIFINGHINGIPGSLVAVTMEGTRPLLLEIQALTTKTGYANPKRSATGIDYNRLGLILAVLEKRAGLSAIFSQDVYVNVTGGIDVSEPACDLAIALCIASSLKNIPVIPNCAVFGEVGLLGEIRTVSGIEKRLAEVENMGFENVIIPSKNLAVADAKKFKKLNIIPVKSIIDAFNKGLMIDGR